MMNLLLKTENTAECVDTDCKIRNNVHFYERFYYFRAWIIYSP